MHLDTKKKNNNDIDVNEIYIREKSHYNHIYRMYICWYICIHIIPTSII